MNFIQRISLFIFLIFTSFFFSADSVFAGTNHNLYGYAWSSNVGWIKLNSCTNPSDATTCGSVNYGVNADKATGVVSGYAWNPNIGWITFNESELEYCENAGSPPCKATIDTIANAQGEYAFRGWARACTVFVTGCSGAEKDLSMTGGWDGWIRLDGTDAGGVPFAPKIGPSSATGVAWGSDVLGWVSFASARMISDSNVATLDLTAASPVNKGTSVQLKVVGTKIDNTKTCSITNNKGMPSITTTLVPHATLPDTWVDNNTLYTGTLNTVTTYTYTIMCKTLAGDDIADTADIVVQDNSANNVTVTLSANPSLINSGSGSTLTANATFLGGATPSNSTACSFRNGVGSILMTNTSGNTWTGTKAVSNITSQTTYWIDCTGTHSDTASDSATVNIISGGSGTFDIIASPHAPTAQSVKDGAGPYAASKVAKYTIRVVASGVWNNGDQIDLSLDSYDPASYPTSMNYIFENGNKLTYNNGTFGTKDLYLTFDPADPTLVDNTTWGPLSVIGTSGSEQDNDYIKFKTSKRFIFIEL